VLSLGDIIRRRGEVVGRTTPTGAVLVEMRGGECFELNRVGAVYWSLLEAPQSLGTICEKICAHFEVDHSVVEKDMMSLTEALSTAGLVEVTPRSRLEE
jgi:Coenzyme PQQ synthesis protein D (PqqD)